MVPPSYPPYHEFRLYSDRFVNNLDIAWNLDSLAENDQIIGSIADVIRKSGYLEVGRDPTERDIAKRYGAIGDELDSTLTELETLRAQNPCQDPVKWWPAWTAVNAKMERLLVNEYSDSLS
jgi:hypothetical protein